VEEVHIFRICGRALVNNTFPDTPSPRDKNAPVLFDSLRRTCAPTSSTVLVACIVATLAATSSSLKASPSSRTAFCRILNTLSLLSCVPPPDVPNISMRPPLLFALVATPLLARTASCDASSTALRILTIS
jgi:hypothetical protein